ncbi:MAG: VPDSG-CTERM sorting domain-containing protein, partial [Limisphaera sp.]
RRTGIGILLGALLCTAAATQALPIRLDTAPYISPSTSVPGNPDNQGQGTVQQWLQDLVDEYNAVNNPDLPAVGSNPSVDYSENKDDVLTVTIPSGYAYLTLHWGGNKDREDTSQAWYLGGNGDTFESPTGKGLSGYRLWNPVRVPDGGGTLALLGIGLLALAGYARQRRL